MVKVVEQVWAQSNRGLTVQEMSSVHDLPQVVGNLLRRSSCGSDSCAGHTETALSNPVAYGTVGALKLRMRVVPPVQLMCQLS